jgi:hypothetical protein
MSGGSPVTLFPDGAHRTHYAGNGLAMEPARSPEDSQMTEERRLELLRHVLKFDVEDAISRYEAEAGCCVVDLRMQLDDADRYHMKIESDSQRAHREAAPPAPRMLVFNFRR